MWLRGAHCTLRCVSAEEQRRQTLVTLIELAEGHSPTACWDDQRAMDLLRSQSNPEEMRELGASEWVIREVFQEHDRG